jgi:hypothetical protein
MCVPYFAGTLAKDLRQAFTLEYMFRRKLLQLQRDGTSADDLNPLFAKQ